VSKTASIADGAYTFEMADTHGDEICWQYGADEFNISVNGKPGANSSSGDFRDFVRECFDGRAQYWPRRRRSVRCRVQ
jgi:hypothetical protein